MRAENRAGINQFAQNGDRAEHWRGYVAPGFEPVAHAFAAAIAARTALGAACTIIHRDEIVVDLQGGWQDKARTREWQGDDIALAYSLTKGLTGMAAAVAVSRGLFAYDQPVAEIWPEFAAHGKGAVTVGEALSEQAGLAAIDFELTLENLADEDAICTAIAEQPRAGPVGDPRAIRRVIGRRAAPFRKSVRIRPHCGRRAS